MSDTPPQRDFVLIENGRFDRGGSEPSLAELWNDPVLLAVLARDRLTLGDLQGLVRDFVLSRARRVDCPERAAC